MSTSPESLPNDPEDANGDRLAESPSIDTLAPANTPAPPAEWIAEPEAPPPDATTSAVIDPIPNRR